MAELPDSRILINLYAAAQSADRLNWQTLRQGVEIASLYGGGDDQPAAALLRYEPGAQIPLHEHRGYEHILVLRGSQRDAHGEYGPGDLIVSPPGTRHAVTSDAGCLVLAIWQVPVRFIPEPA